MESKEIIGRILYNLFFKRMPVSDSKYSFKSKKFRALSARLFLEECGKNINIEHSANIGRNVKLGNNFGIGKNAVIHSNVTIQDNVMMGPECVIYTANHEFSSIEKPMNRQVFQQLRPVVIENDVWIGGRVIILPGIRVKKGSIIGAGSVVTKDVPSYSIVAGNPEKVIRKR